VVALLPALAGASPAAPLQALEPLLADAAGQGSYTVRGAHPASALIDGRLRVLVRLAVGAPADTLQGFTAERAVGPVVPLQVAPERLKELASRPGVLMVEACRTVGPHLDLSGDQVGAAAARHKYSMDGQGVVVGIVDTGLDFRHQDFQHKDGKTRVLHLLDVSQTVKGSKETYNARAYSQQEINTQLELDRKLGKEAPVLVSQQDLNGHGTHVAGIAAGNGRAAASGFTPGRYVGVAPGASLIIVQASKDNTAAFHDADLIHGVQYIFERATALGLPAVVNLSVGTPMGPHDGTSNLAMAVSALTGGAGRVIVTSAGNDGGRDLHAMGFPALGGPDTVVLNIPAYTPSSSRELVHLELWYGEGDLTLQLTSPAGRTLEPVSTRQSQTVLTSEGLVKILNAPGGPYKPNGRYQAAVVVDEKDTISPAPGRWTLHLTGSASRYDVWLVNPGIRGQDNERPQLLGPLDANTSLSSPGTAQGVISVGAYSTRGIWESVAGKVGNKTVREGLYSYFSSSGPTLDGRFLPDVVAPGEFIISAMSMHAYPLHSRSAFYLPSIPFGLWHEDQVRGVLRGTSQAAPHVAGVAALLLQRDPSLTLEQVRELLRVGARADAHVGWGRAWSPRWGFGKVDALRSLALLDGLAAGKVDPGRSGVAVNRDLLPPGGGQQATVTIIPRDAHSQPLGAGRAVVVHTTAGRVTSPQHVARGRYEAELIPEAGMGRTARITVTVDNVELNHHPQVLLGPRRDLAGQHLRSSGGGCALHPLMPTSPSPAGALLILLGLVCVLVGRRP